MQKKTPDMRIFILTLLLLVIGLLMVYDASYARASHELHHDSMKYMKLQSRYAVLGILFMFAAMRIPYWKYRPYTGWLVGIAIVGLLLVFTPLGHAANGAKRWLDFRVTRVQPSEIAKLCMVIYVAFVLAAKKSLVRDWREIAVPIGVPVGAVGLLIVKEDMGTAIVFIATMFVMLFMAGARARHLLTVAGGFVVLGLFLAFSKPYRAERMMTFVDPFKDSKHTGYQVCQSLIAVGSGGVRGMGFCEGRQKLFYLPEEYTDFIFAVLGQEWGLIGTLSMTALFLMFGYFGLSIARKTKEGFGRLIAGGISILISGQALLNMLVVTSSVPATGVPLPFISYGGSSLIINLICVGVLLGVSQYPGVIADYEKQNSSDRRRDRGTRVSGDQHRRRTAVGSSRR